MARRVSLVGVIRVAIVFPMIGVMAFSLRPAAPRAEPMPRLRYPDLLRRALLFSHDLLRQQDPVRLREMLVRDAAELLGASVARLYLPDWDNAGLAVATALERERVDAELEQLRRSAFTDRLTGLPNDQALQRELEAHAQTWPLSVLVLDFDGLRAANAAFGNRDGGDVLISAVGAELARLAAADEYPAPMYTAGDEFALLLPGQDEQAALRRRAEIEAGLDALVVPERLASIYQGASVGAATRRPGETAGQALGRAITAMRTRKNERRHRQEIRP